MLDRQTVLRGLRCPNLPLVKLALTYVNLSKKEETCLFSTILADNTDENAAEELGVSRDYVSRHKLKAISRIQNAWEFCPILPLLLQYE